MVSTSGSRHVSALGEGCENVRKDECTRIEGYSVRHPVKPPSTTVLGKELMMDNGFEVAVGAGTMMSSSAAAVGFPHQWTSGGVTVEADFTGGHLFHLAAAGCVLNDLYGKPQRWALSCTGFT